MSAATLQVESPEGKTSATAALSGLLFDDFGERKDIPPTSKWVLYTGERITFQGRNTTPAMIVSALADFWPDTAKTQTTVLTGDVHAIRSVADIARNLVSHFSSQYWKENLLMGKSETKEGWDLWGSHKCYAIFRSYFSSEVLQS